MTVAEALTMLGVACVFMGAVFLLLYVSVNRTSPVGILRRLRTSSTSEYVVRLRGTEKGWIPGRADPFDWVVGPGTATYRLLRGHDGSEVVDLNWDPGDAASRHSQGVVSPRLSRLADGRRIGNVLLSPVPVIAVQSALAVIGVAAGLGVTAGNDQSSRAAAVFIGFFCGAAVPVVAVPAVLMLIALRRMLRPDGSRR